MIWWESRLPDDALPWPLLDAALPRFFNRLKSAAMAHAWELFPAPMINPNKARTPRIMKRNHGTNWLSVKQSQKPSYQVNASHDGRYDDSFREHPSRGPSAA
jgi:hypothetical protein